MSLPFCVVTAAPGTGVAGLIGRTATVRGFAGVIRTAEHATYTGRWGIAISLILPGGRTEWFGIHYGDVLLVDTPIAD